MATYHSNASDISKPIETLLNMIGFNNGKSSIFAAFLAILTSFSFLEVDPELFQIEESAIFTQKSKFVFDYLTDSHHIPEVHTYSN